MSLPQVLKRLYFKTNLPSRTSTIMPPQLAARTVTAPAWLITVKLSQLLCLYTQTPHQLHAPANRVQ